MGQVLQRIYNAAEQQSEGLIPADPLLTPSPVALPRGQPRGPPSSFPDLSELPPELGLTVLSYLNPTDLCLAACVWDHLANDELLWQR